MTPEKKSNFRLPEGVARGADFFSRRRDSLAEKRRIAFPEERVDVVIIKKQAAEYLNLPVLESDSQTAVRSWVPRYNPLSGAIWTSRWSAVTLVKTPENKHQLDKAEDFVVVGGRRSDKDIDLIRMPLSWKVAQLIPQEYPDGIESAMRAYDEIAHDYSQGGVEDLRTLTALATVYQLVEEMKKPGLTAADLDNLKARAEANLSQENLLTVIDPVWRKMTQSIVKASTQDRLNRVNPSAGRFSAISAYLRAVERQALAGLVKNKSERTYAYLFMVRLATRLRIKESLDMLDKIGNFSLNYGFAEFKNKYPDFNVQNRVDLEQSLKLVSIELARVKVAPYFATARLTEAILFGQRLKTNYQIAALKMILTKNNLTNELVRLSADDYLRKKDVSRFYRRLRHAYNNLKELYEDQDYRTYTTFSDQIPDL